MDYEEWCQLTKYILDCVELNDSLPESDTKQKLSIKLHKILEISGDNITIN